MKKFHFCVRFEYYTQQYNTRVTHKYKVREAMFFMLYTSVSLLSWKCYKVEFQYNTGVTHKYRVREVKQKKNAGY